VPTDPILRTRNLVVLFCPKSFRVAFVDANCVAVGVENHGHAADGRGKRLHPEFHAVRAQMRDGRVEIFNFQRHRAAVGAGFPAGGGADGKRARANIIFRPMRVGREVLHLGGFQTQHALVKLARPGEVGDGVAAKGNFGDVQHELLRRPSQVAHEIRNFSFSLGFFVNRI